MTRSSHNFKRSLNLTDNGSIIYGFRNNLTCQRSKVEYTKKSWDHPEKRIVPRSGDPSPDKGWESIWKSLSESDKLQSAMVSDIPPNAEVAYYKGLSYKDFGPEYSGDAMAAFRQALLLCGPEDATIKERCESELRILEAQNKTQVIPSEQLTQIHNEIDHLKDLILAVKKSVDQLVRKVDGV